MSRDYKELLTVACAQPFSYDHNTSSFSYGDQTYEPEAVLHYDEDFLTTNTPTADIMDAPLAQTTIGLVMLPHMYDWLEDNLTNELANETTTVMRDVFVRLRPDMESHAQKGALWGFDMGRLRREHPHITLSTIGNCACLGVDLQGVFGVDAWDEKFASFGFHNIDLPEQRVSLLAGIGHIAHRTLSL